MKIQEMRSGILHLNLNKKMENEGRENVFEPKTASAALAESNIRAAADGEMDEPRWSVISFSQREAGGLTYDQAIVLISELDSYDIAGLCIVTDAAAARL